MATVQVLVEVDFAAGKWRRAGDRPTVSCGEKSRRFVASHEGSWAGWRPQRSGSYETWVYDGAANTWTNMKPKDAPPGFGNRRRVMAYVPDLNVVVMENYVNPPQRVPGADREQQIWTYR
jgi:hypothetical protein